jgi:hypothetical protein
MTGVELARTAVRERPDLPVLIVSGYSDAIGIDAQLPRLEKPFRQADLAARLAAVLSPETLRLQAASGFASACRASGKLRNAR